MIIIYQKNKLEQQNFRAVGRVGTVEFKTSKNGVGYLSFSVCIKQGIKDKDIKSEWINCVAFGELAISKMQKGDIVAVDGNWKQEHYLDKTTGEEKTSYKYIAEYISVRVKVEGDTYADRPTKVDDKSEDNFNSEDIPF